MLPEDGPEERGAADACADAASTDWAPSDRLSYSLTAAVLKLAAGGAGERRGTLAALTSFHAGVLKEIDTSPGRPLCQLHEAVED